MSEMRVVRGHKLRPELIELTYAQYAFMVWDEFVEVRRTAGQPDMPLKIGLPGTLEIPMFAFGQRNPALGLLHRKSFSVALKREVDAIVGDPKIADDGGSELADNIEWQLEVPAEIGGMSKVPGRFQLYTDGLAGRFFAAGIIDQVRGLPPRSTVFLHNCYGDLGRRAFSKPPTMDPVVALTTATIRRWPQGPDAQTLRAVHLPIGSGECPPTSDPRFFEPLRRLAAVLDRLPADRRPQVSAGIAHEEATLRQQIDTVNRIEDILGRRVNIAPACGLARCETAEVASQVVARCVELANA